MSDVPFTKPEDELAAEFFSTTIAQLSGAGMPERLLEEEEKLPPFPDEPWRAAAESGWFRLLLPEELDGLGLGYAELGAIFRAVGHRLMRGPLLDHAVALPLIAAATSEALRGEISAALDGESTIVLAQPLPRPYGAGSDLTLAGAELRGTADLVSFGAAADSFVVVADRDGETVLLLVSASAAEVRERGSHDPTVELATVGFSDVEVAADRVLLEGAAAARTLAMVHGAQRLMAVAELSGAVEEMTAMAVSYAGERVQFERPIAGFQALRHILAEMTGKASTLLSLSDAALWDADADRERVPELGRLAKAFSAEPSRFVAEQALQVYGGVGFTHEVPLHLFMRRALSLQGFLGEDADLFTEIGSAVLEAV